MSDGEIDTCAFLEKEEEEEEGVDTSTFLNDDDEEEIDTSAFAEEEDSPEDIPDKINYLILGAPKSGNNFITKVFEKIGLDIGHEEHGKDGISDWSLVPENSTFFPSSTTCRRDLNVEKIVHIVKNPFTVISDIWHYNYCILEDNSADPNMELVTMYEATKYRMDFLNIYRNVNGIDNCIISYLGWNEEIEKLEPDYTLHIERIQKDITVIPEYKPFTLESYTSPKRLKLSNSIWQKANPELIEKLDTFCVKHGYKKISKKINNFEKN